MPAFTPRLWRLFLDRGGDPEALSSGDAAAIGRALGLRGDAAQALARDLLRADPERELAARAAGIEVVASGAEAYPAPLRQLVDPPPVLFLRGPLLPCDVRAVPVVGSRRATPYGLPWRGRWRAISRAPG